MLSGRATSGAGIAGLPVSAGAFNVAEARAGGIGGTGRGAPGFIGFAPGRAFRPFFALVEAMFGTGE